MTESDEHRFEFLPGRFCGEGLGEGVKISRSWFADFLVAWGSMLKLTKHCKIQQKIRFFLHHECNVFWQTGSALFTRASGYTNNKQNAKKSRGAFNSTTCITKRCMGGTKSTEETETKQSNLRWEFFDTKAHKKTQRAQNGHKQGQPFWKEWKAPGKIDTATPQVWNHAFGQTTHWIKANLLEQRQKHGKPT